MGLFDRMRQKQDVARRRNEALGDFGDEIINAGEHISRAVKVLQGHCPNCQTVNQAQSEAASMTVTCVSCQRTTVTLT